MSGRTSRQVRKEINRLMRNNKAVADNLVLELLNSPLKYRLAFAFKLVFHRRIK